MKKAYQATGEQVRIVYEAVFGKPMRPAQEVEVKVGKKTKLSMQPEMSYQEAISELEAQYTAAQVEQLLDAVPNNAKRPPENKLSEAQLKEPIEALLQQFKNI